MILKWLRKANKTGSGYGSGFIGIADEDAARFAGRIRIDQPSD